jgi:hypothetical protein
LKVLTKMELHINDSLNYSETVSDKLLIRNIEIAKMRYQTMMETLMSTMSLILVLTTNIITILIMK